MIDILLCGAGGQMGRAIAVLAEQRDDCRIVAGIDPATVTGAAFPVFTSPDGFYGRADVIIDFSNPKALEPLLKYALASKTPAVLATTGLSPEQISMIKSAARDLPVFFSANMSLGVNLLLHLVKTAERILGGGFDVEIIERHHNKKLDAPSGTALMLADGISQVAERELQYVYDRHSRHQARRQCEVGIHSVRGGTIVGEHEVIFAGSDEVLTISHSAASKRVFAAGALRAALFVTNQPPGLYDMEALVSSGDE